MGDIRIGSKPTKATPIGADSVLGIDSITTNDVRFTMDAIAAFVATAIGLASSSVNGLMSTVDKDKLDLYPSATPGNNKVLISNGSGVLFFEDLAAISAGDMLAANYDTGGAGNKVDASVEADKISGTPGNDKLYGTNNVGIQIFLAQSLFLGDMLASVYDPSANGDKVAKAELADDSLKINGRSVTTWNGSTTDATPTEIFLDGISQRLPVAVGNALAVSIDVVGLQDDLSDGVYFKRQLMIKNIAGTTSLISTVKTIGTDIDTAPIGGIAITADNTNDSLKVEVTGIAAENWDWEATAIITEI